MQHGAATGCNADLPTHKKSHIPLVAAPCTLTDVAAVPPRGVEQGDQASGKSETPVQGGTVCGTADAQNPPLDPQLQLLIQRWPTLSQQILQQQIMLLKNSASFFPPIAPE